MQVLKSKYTKGLKDGTGVSFEIGDEVTYMDINKKTGTVKVISDRMTHLNGNYGYEATCDRFGDFFMSEQNIVNWEGKA